MTNSRAGSNSPLRAHAEPATQYATLGGRTVDARHLECSVGLACMDIFRRDIFRTKRGSGGVFTRVVAHAGSHVIGAVVRSPSSLELFSNHGQFCMRLKLTGTGY